MHALPLDSYFSGWNVVIFTSLKIVLLLCFLDFLIPSVLFWGRLTEELSIDCGGWVPRPALKWQSNGCYLPAHFLEQCGNFWISILSSIALVNTEVLKIFLQFNQFTGWNIFRWRSKCFFLFRWRELLSNRKCEGVTPMRRLIEKYPQVAKVSSLLFLWHLNAFFVNIFNKLDH